MSFDLLQTVVVRRDLAEHGLCEGDLGTVVEVYGTTGIEVEFVRASGDTEAVVTLEVGDVRSLTDFDLFSIRRLDRRS